MSGVSVDMVKQLRDATGAKFKECMEALSESKGDMEAAKEVLRAKGLAGAVSKTSRDASSGAVGLFSAAGSGVFMCKLRCETDYVAMNDAFLSILSAVGNVALRLDAPTAEILLKEKMDDGNTVEEAIKLAITSTGENIRLDDEMILLREQADVVFGTYVHKEYGKGMGKIGVVVVLKCSERGDERVKGLADDIAMQVAAMKPVALDRHSIDPAVVESEKDAQVAKAKSMGKPEHIMENVVKGSMEKFFKTVTLVDQPFVIGNATANLSVQGKADEVAKEVGKPIEIVGYHAYFVE